PIPFRATCYYYRRAYYRSWFLSPPGCAVGDASRKYRGETALPFWFNNLHRFAMYIALVFVPILWYGALRSFYNSDEIIDGKAVETGFGIGLGSVFLVVNACLLDRKSTRLNSSHQIISYAVFCLKKKKKAAMI